MTKEDFLFSKTKEYLKKITQLECYMSFEDDFWEKRGQEYLDLILRYGAVTPRSKEILASLENDGTYGTMNDEKHLDNGIAQATEEMPCTEGETDMAKRIKQRVEIGGKIKWVTGNSHQEVLLAAARLLAENGVIMPEQTSKPTSLNFASYAEQWLRLYKSLSICEETSLAYHTQFKNHILPFFGDKSLSEIKTADVQEFFVRLQEKGLSHSYCRQMKGHLNALFDAAVDDKLINENPVKSKRVVLPTKEEKREALSLDEVQDVIQQMDKLKGLEKLMLALLLFTGMRRGETLGLRWEHVDFEKKIINVTQQVVYGDGNQPIVKAPKSKAGIRKIPLVAELEAILKPYRGTGYVLSNKGLPEMPITLMVFKRMWERIEKKINLHGATPHILRHTFITMGVGKTDIKTLQTIAGHSNINITLNRYAHPREEKVREAAHSFTGMYA